MSKLLKAAKSDPKMIVFIVNKGGKFTYMIKVGNAITLCKGSSGYARRTDAVKEAKRIINKFRNMQDDDIAILEMEE